jgi:hypothetical protein|tara:strand:- start:333 stop:560 length:228 start_codon:yes stop_codon:yes gene_type:complete
MKVGDLVRSLPLALQTVSGEVMWGPAEGPEWVGIILSFYTAGPNNEKPMAIVMWNEAFPQEAEYLEQLEVVNESR